MICAGQDRGHHLGNGHSVLGGLTSQLAKKPHVTNHFSSNVGHTNNSAICSSHAQMPDQAEAGLAARVKASCSQEETALSDHQEKMIILSEGAD
jgi:hypothetical protein